MRKVLLIAIGVCFIMSGTSFAFHDGGVAHCNGCHTMHNSEDGAPIDASPVGPVGNPYLLVDDSPSDVCIACHNNLDRTYPIGGDVMAPPAQRAGGNFIFLDEDNLNDGHNGHLSVISGDAAGHNLYAPAHGLSADGTLLSAPGGTFSGEFLGCTSCHDPHGTSDFRFLYGTGRIVQGEIFTAPAPVATGVTIFAGVSNGFKTAYNSGMSAWCGNCHGDYHDQPGGALIHPSGTGLGTSIATAYGAYNGTGEPSGLSSASYLEAVPFEDAANTNFSTGGPNANSQVMCLSCHRAHASSAPNAGRWDFSVTLLHEDGDGGGAVDTLTGDFLSPSFPIPNPYAATAGDNQRSLCNKCHEKDDFDTIH